MKKNALHTLIVAFVGVSFIISCKKEEHLAIDRPIDNSQYFINNREYFWAQSWQRSPNGYEMTLQTQMLTDSVINKGIKVGVAIYSEMSRFEPLPVTIDYSTRPGDTVQLTYTVMPGKLKVLAKTPATITWASDVFIQF